MASPPTADPRAPGGFGRGAELAVVAAAAVPLAVVAWRFDFLCDDAYVSFRWARHLVEGHGLTFNPGESQPAGGPSNLLWVLWLTACSRLGAPMEIASRVTSFACGVALVALFVRFLARRAEFPVRTVLAAALFLAVMPPVALWSTGGLETMPFALACFATFERLCGDPEHPDGVAAGLCAATAALLRPDGAMWAAVVIAAAALGWTQSRSPLLRRAMIAATLLLAVTVAADVCWRHEHFGQWLPGSALVRPGPQGIRLQRGVAYLAGLALAVPPLAIVPAVVLAGRGRPAPLLAVQAGTVVGAGLLYAICVGGDALPMGRIVVAAMPFVALLFAIAAARIARIGRAGPHAVFASVCLTVLLLADAGVAFVPRGVLQTVHHRWEVKDAPTEVEVWDAERSRTIELTRLGRALALHTRPGESIVLESFGAIGYETELVIHDEESPPKSFLKHHPTYVYASLEPAGAPIDERLPGEWVRALRRVSYQFERRTLPAEEFGAGVELRLLRMR